MYARLTRFAVDPARLSELRPRIEEMRPRFRSLPGLVDAYVAWRGDGQGMVVALYEDRRAADRVVSRIQAIWGAVAGLLEGPPLTDAFEDAERITEDPARNSAAQRP